MKRKKLDDVTCLFCTELESVRHLFFECCVAQSMWETSLRCWVFMLAKILNPLLNCGLVTRNTNMLMYSMRLFYGLCGKPGITCVFRFHSGC
jgi:hypothetical protein